VLIILIGGRRAMAGDTRFVEFVDDAATRLGRLIDAAAGGRGPHERQHGIVTERRRYGT